MGDRVATIDIWAETTWAESEGLLCALPWGKLGPQSSNAVSPGPRPISVPSGILIHPTVWPPYTNVTNRTDRTTAP